MLRHEELASDVDIKDLAKRTESFSGSDLKRSSGWFFPLAGVNRGLRSVRFCCRGCS